MSDLSISVIIPTYNRKEKTLRAVKSVLDQKVEDVEIIVVDDGSNDGTSEFLQNQKLPIKILSKENGGVSSARNFGIKNSSGKCLAFLDSDDVWLPNKLKKQIEFLKSNPEIFLVYTDQYININGKNLDETRFQRNSPNIKLALPAFVDFTPIHISTVLIKREVFEKIGYFDESLTIHEDSEFWNRISDHYDFGYIEEPLSVYYWESEGDHLTNLKNRKKFIENGRRYIDLYISNKRGNLTKEQQGGVDKSLKIIAEMEEND